MRVFYLKMVEHGHIPRRHNVKEYEELTLYPSLSFFTRATSLTILSARLCSHRVIHIKGSYKGVPYKVHNLITFIQPKRSSRATLQWRQDSSSCFFKDEIMSFQPTNLKSIIHYMKYIITNFDFNVHNPTTRLKVPHKTLLTSFKVTCYSYIQD